MVFPNSSTPLLPRGSTFVTPSLLWKSGAILVTAGMIAGAFGSHALKRRPGITPEGLSAWGTASHYAIFNGLALFVLSMHPRFSTHKFAGPAIAGGGFVFSGSIIALVLWKLKFLGPITPLGGIAMIAGYNDHPGTLDKPLLITWNVPKPLVLLLWAISPILVVR